MVITGNYNFLLVSYFQGTITSDNALDRETDAQQVVYVMVKSSLSSCQAQVSYLQLKVNHMKQTSM